MWFTCAVAFGSIIRRQEATISSEADVVSVIESSAFLENPIFAGAIIGANRARNARNNYGYGRGGYGEPRHNRSPPRKTAAQLRREQEETERRAQAAKLHDKCRREALQVTPCPSCGSKWYTVYENSSPECYGVSDHSFTERCPVKAACPEESLKVIPNFFQEPGVPVAMSIQFVEMNHRPLMDCEVLAVRAVGEHWVPVWTAEVIAPEKGTTSDELASAVWTDERGEGYEHPMIKAGDALGFRNCEVALKSGDAQAYAAWRTGNEATDYFQVPQEFKLAIDVTMTPTFPSLPTITYIERKPHAMRVHWTAPEHDGGNDKWTFRINVNCPQSSSRTDHETVMEYVMKDAPAAAEYAHTFDGLAPSACKFTVRAFNSVSEKYVHDRRWRSAVTRAPVMHFGCGNWLKHCCYRSDLAVGSEWHSELDPLQGPVCTRKSCDTLGEDGDSKTWVKGDYYGCGQDK